MILPKAGVLFGARTVIDGKYPENDLGGVYQREEDLGRKFAVVTTFRNFNDNYTSEQELIAGGRVPQISWPVRGSYPGHSAILSGAHDKELALTAAQWAGLARPVLIRMFWEMNGSSYGSDPSGTVAAWQHIWRIMKPVAPNTTWVWNMMPRPTYDHRWLEFNPGAHYLALPSLDAYDKNPSDRYLADILHQGDYAAQSKSDDWYATMTAAFPGKHLMVSEGGQREVTDPTNERPAKLSKAAWWGRVVADLKSNPMVKVFCPWDCASLGGDWRFDTTPTPGVYDVNGETFQAVKAAVNDPYMNP